MVEELLVRIPLFAGLPRAELATLVATLRQRNFPAQAIIFSEGAPGECFYILTAGQVEIVKALGTSDERLLAVQGAGAFLGEMSLFEKGGVHTASVRAQQPVELLEMSRADFEALLSRQPLLAYDMVRVVSARLSESENTTIRELREKNRQLTQAYQELQAAQAQLVEKEKLERELEVARQIQSSILPRELPRCDGYRFDAVMVPMRAVGGDLFDFIPLGKDLLGVAVGDVSDHGVPAALFMALATTLLRAEAQRVRSPREVLLRVNRQLMPINDTGMYVTLLYGLLDLAKGEFHYVRAGHELPLLLAGDGKPHPVPMGQGMPLGIFDEPLLDEQSLKLEPGSALLIYTDGVSDALDPQEEAFGKQRLLETMQRESPAHSKTGLCHRILAEVQRFSAEANQFDDITLLSIQT